MCNFTNHQSNAIILQGNVIINLKSLRLIPQLISQPQKEKNATN